ncbi:MAG: cupin domain-containing protein [Pigmentiphaga sp.]|uniref:cupin domain-containing protein n=1 Tax=Pigmentiphaga sp. TaxID=1977564 RepID=UPI0029BD1BA5|nr:cupin domain-containing protein [Pigmentiphaga sp.]MDX3906070.1 cupin domain-containing protein [Pigmentiphaga sp.]
MKTLDVSPETMLARTARFEDYGRLHAQGPLAAAAEALWGARLVPLMGARNTKGRLAGPPVPSPARACTGYAAWAAGARSLPYRNPDAMENLLCLEGTLHVRFGPDLAHEIRLERFDLLSIPADVLHQVFSDGKQGATGLVLLNGAPDCAYPALFAEPPAAPVDADALAALNAALDAGRGRAIDPDAMAQRVTRFASLVPYKRALNARSAIPPEATEWLTASSVFPLLIPEGHVGRSQDAPLKGLPGLYVAIAECVPGDGPLPHAHFDTQESFFVLDGEWDISWGFEDEFRLPARRFDLVAVPTGVMRAFRNTGKEPARLFVIIQGQERMSDTVVYSPKVGEEVHRRFGPEVVDALRKVNITFDAERG